MYWMPSPEEQCARLPICPWGSMFQVLRRAGHRNSVREPPTETESILNPWLASLCRNGARRVGDYN